MKKFFLPVIAAATLILAGCTSIKPFCATSNELGSKVGESTSSYLFGVLPLGEADSSIQKAAKNGGIKKISTVDQKVTTGIFVTRITTIVTGE